MIEDSGIIRLTLPDGKHRFIAATAVRAVEPALVAYRVLGIHTLVHRYGNDPSIGVRDEAGEVEAMLERASI